MFGFPFCYFRFVWSYTMYKYIFILCCCCCCFCYYLTALIKFQSATPVNGPFCSLVLPWTVSIWQPAVWSICAYFMVLFKSSNRRILHVTGIAKFLCSVLTINKKTQQRKKMREKERKRALIKKLPMCLCVYIKHIKVNGKWSVFKESININGRYNIKWTKMKHPKIWTYLFHAAISIRLGGMNRNGHAWLLLVDSPN